ncbi:hypothetical protein Mapa_000970 [Marchantia paleacea]|nr:hypothetical protein Mapa_000970 [Marchantia paleacea]
MESGGGEFMGLVLALVAALTVVLIRHQVSSTQKKNRRMRLPPSPSGAWLVLRHLPRIGSHPHQSLMNLSKKYGPIMYLRL